MLSQGKSTWACAFGAAFGISVLSGVDGWAKGPTAHHGRTQTHLAARRAATPDSARAPAGTPNGGVDSAGAGESCVADTLCRIKGRISRKAHSWKPETCRTMARGFLDTAARHDLHPALLIAVAINESDLNEEAFATDTKDGAVHATDGGLMGIRCITDKKGRCTNGNVRGISWKDVMDPLTNIELGARELSHYRDGAGIELIEKSRKGRRGEVTVRKHYVRCKHKTHAYWAHYNHGPIYKGTSDSRHYPHRVAVLYYALAQAMSMEIPDELATGTLTVRDRGKRARQADRPVETRYKELTSIIAESGSCRSVALAE